LEERLKQCEVKNANNSEGSYWNFYKYC
jgi:hypothetical protein